MPAWIISYGVWKPLIRRLGMSNAPPLAADRLRDRLDHRLVRGEFGAVGQGDGDQVVERPGGVEQGELEVIGLDRVDHRAGVEAEDLGQVGAVDAPLLPRHGACCSRSATRFRARSTSTTGTSSRLNWAMRSIRSWPRSTQ